MINENKCKGCDWCVQACEQGGITINTETGLAITCDLCGGEPQCIEFCPEEALELVATDEEAEKRFNDAIERMPAQCEEMTNAVKDRNWKPLLAEAEERSMKVADKLEKLSKKAREKKK